MEEKVRKQIVTKPVETANAAGATPPEPDALEELLAFQPIELSDAKSAREHSKGASGCGTGEGGCGNTCS